MRKSEYPHIGMLRQADEFALAARYIDEACRARKRTSVYLHVDIEVYGVFCYLCAHAIELALKSILILNGYEDSRLRKLGHDLIKNWDQVEKCDFPNKENILNKDLRILVEWLNHDYKNKELEYYKGPSYRSMPHSDPVLEVTSKLVSSLNDEYRVLLHHSRRPQVNT